MSSDGNARVRNDFARKIFFDKQVHMDSWKDSMSGKNEEMVLKAFEFLGYKLGKDFVRQHPIGDRFVLDFAFISEKIAIEIDGKGHKERKHRFSDKKRDRFLYNNQWVVIRIPEERFFGYLASFYKFLIKEVVDKRREQLEEGFLYQIDVPEFKEEDY